MDANGAIQIVQDIKAEEGANLTLEPTVMSAAELYLLATQLLNLEASMANVTIAVRNIQVNIFAPPQTKV